MLQERVLVVPSPKMYPVEHPFQTLLQWNNKSKHAAIVNYDQVTSISESLYIEYISSGECHSGTIEKGSILKKPQKMGLN